MIMWALATKCARSIMKSFFIFCFIIFGNSYTVPGDNKPGDTQHVIIRSSVQSCCWHHNHFKHPLPVILRLLNTNCLKARCRNPAAQHDGVNATSEAKEDAFFFFTFVIKELAGAAKTSSAHQEFRYEMKLKSRSKTSSKVQIDN